MESEPLPSGFPLDVIENDKEYVVTINVTEVTNKQPLPPVAVAPLTGDGLVVAISSSFTKFVLLNQAPNRMQGREQAQATYCLRVNV